jgi:hypothetical protein
MEDSQKDRRADDHWEDLAPATRWLVILCVLVFAGAVFAVAYAFEQNAALADMKQQNQAMSSTQLELRNQIHALSEKVAQMTTPSTAAPAVETPAGNGAREATRTAARRSGSVPDRRVKQLQAQLSDQQKELKRTQDDLASARSDLEGRIGSTRDELNGSIARTHEELVTLEKRGERRYYEFDLTKSKSFEREGPIQVSLRKADTKHQSYDLMMLVDDHQLSKKKVDLYESIWLQRGDMPEPLQVVVNQISKDHVHGYVSAPRYKESELASNAQQPAADLTARPTSTASSSSPTYNSSTPTSTSATPSQGQYSPVD